MTRQSIPLAGVVLLAVSASGCSKPYNVAEVEGVLLIHGAPGHKIHVQFIPDVDKATKGPISTADTDAAGRFTLRLNESSSATSSLGAVVGWHRVVLSDLQLAESATGAGVAVRLAPDYTLPGSTPLTQEIKEGKQTIELNVP